MTLSDTDTAQLWETFRAGGGAELVRGAVRLVLQELIEAEVTEAIGAGRYERSDARVNERNGHRPRLLATQAGDVELRIPKLPQGLVVAVGARAAPAHRPGPARGHHGGLRGRGVHPIGGRSGGRVGRGVGDLEVGGVAHLRGARRDGGGVQKPAPRPCRVPYVYVDATYLKVRNSVSQVVSMAMVVATGVTTDGNREILGCDIGDSESEGFWQSFLGSLRARGLTGVRLVIADAPRGLGRPRTAPSRAPGASDAGCTSSATCSLWCPAPTSTWPPQCSAPSSRSPTPKPSDAAWDEVAAQLGARFPKVAALMADAKPEVLAFAAFPRAHWQKIWSTNPSNASTKRSNADHASWGSFPNQASAIRLVRRHPRRPPRRMASHRAPLPLRALHGHPQPPSAIPSPQPSSHPATNTEAQPQSPPLHGTPPGSAAEDDMDELKSRQGVGFNVAFCKPGGMRRLRVEAYIDTGNKTPQLRCTRTLNRGAMRSRENLARHWNGIH